MSIELSERRGQREREKQSLRVELLPSRRVVKEHLTGGEAGTVRLLVAAHARYHLLGAVRVHEPGEGGVLETADYGVGSSSWTNSRIIWGE